MRKLIKNLLEHNSFWIAICITILIAYLSLKTLQIETPIEIKYFDKVLHFTAYFTLSISWLFHVRNNNKNKYFVILFIFLYGILLEFMQGWFNPNRTKDVYDIFANGLGIVIAIISYKYIYDVYKKIFVVSN